MVEIGLEAFAREPGRWVRPGERAGLLMSAASVDAWYRSARDVVAGALGERLVCLFGPQHGVYADVQDNMVESAHGKDPRLGIPVWSLYGETRVPKPRMLKGLDVLLVDLQDVGTRVYTYFWTLRNVLGACAREGVRVVVLDRPNPIGGVEVEGNVLEEDLRSFVGLEPIPMRHGMTVGEIAKWFVECRGVDCELDVVPLSGWRREMHWPDTGRPWVMTSPNLPAYETALVYPGTVLLEGTNASEGRGTTRPFEIVGGAWGRAEELAEALSAKKLPGAVFRPLAFQPTFHKWCGETCHGFQLHVTDVRAFRPYATGLAILSAFWKLYAETGFDWRAPPYEYEEFELPIHLLLGSRKLREAIEAGADLDEMERSWQGPLESWMKERAGCLLY